MRRREFIAGLAGATAWPLVAPAQQPGLPVVGFLSVGPPGGPGIDSPASFRRGLSETGYIEGRNVTIEYRFANNAGVQQRLTELAADLVDRRVTVIAASGLSAALAAKAATATIPIVFRTGNDPVQHGLVASFNRPGANVIGVNDIGVDLAAKRLGLLHELVPGASRFAAHVDPTSPATESTVVEATAAAMAIGRSIEVVTASTNREIDTAFASLVQKSIDALWVSTDVLFASRRAQLVTLAAYHRLPAIYPARVYAEVGGLMSYGTGILDSVRQVGVYTGRILKGEKPADLPVLRPTKYETVINNKTAKALGLTIPETLLATADEVIQ
jgi:putative tryptophan/tyrosine transport system substrate-binding protein